MRPSTNRTMSADERELTPGGGDAEVETVDADPIGAAAAR
jgi:hypothetical protein